MKLQAGNETGQCPLCGTARSGKFCEDCGLDFDSGKVPRRFMPTSPAARGAAVGSRYAAGAGEEPPSRVGRAVAWSARVTADRDYYDKVTAAAGPDAGAIGFPAACEERCFQLTGQNMRIGRRSASRGIEPEIDLAGASLDPGVSRLHAVLIAEPDGGWAILDPGSANGVLVNGSEIDVGMVVPLYHGDRIHLGAWTQIVIQMRSAPPDGEPGASGSHDNAVLPGL